MQENEKIQLFENAPIPRAVAKLAVPMIFSSLVMVLYNMADTYFVGMMNDPVENAAVSLAAPVLLAFNAVNNLFGVGTSSMMSRALGRKDYETVSESSAFGFYCSLISGVLFGLLCGLLNSPLLTLIGVDATTRTATQGYMFWTVYLGAAPAILNVVMAYLVRSEGAALHASIGTMSGCLLNIVLDPIMIYTLDMGVAGAAWATVIAFIVSCAIAAYWYLRDKSMYISISRSDYRPDARVWRGIMSVGGPEALELSIMYLFNIFLNYVVIEVGGTDMVGLYSTGWRIANFIMIVGQAMGGAMVAVCAAEYGMKRFDLIRTAFRYSVVTSVLMTAALSVVLALAAGPLSSVFTMSDDLAYLHGDMTEMLRIFALFLPVMSLVYTGSSLMQSIDRATGGMINSLARNIILSAGMYAAMVAFGTLTSLWWATAIAEILGGLMMFAHARIVLRRVEREESDADPQAGAE